MRRVVSKAGGPEVVLGLSGGEREYGGRGYGIRRYRAFEVGNRLPVSFLTFPDGLVTLVVSLEGRLRLDETHETPRLFRSPVCGPRTRALRGETTGPFRGLMVSMTPWSAFCLFGRPMRSLVDRVVELSGSADALAGELVAALSRVGDWPRRLMAVDRLLLDRMRSGPSSAGGVASAWQELVRSAGRMPVSMLAARVGWCERQLETRFREQVGLAPKTLARILRAVHARRLLRAGRTPKDVAVRCGYYDQSHLSRELKSITGFTPSWFTRTDLRSREKDFGFFQATGP